MFPKNGSNCTQHNYRSFSPFFLFYKERLGRDTIIVMCLSPLITFKPTDFHETWFQHHFKRCVPTFVLFTFQPSGTMVWSHKSSEVETILVPLNEGSWKFL
jgi:hypothetical protein